MLGIAPGLALYAGLFLLLLACLWGAAFIARGWLRWGWALVFALAALFVDSFQAATADAMSYDAFVTMIRSAARSEEHTSELQSLMRISYAVFCLKKKKNISYPNTQ